MIYKDTQELLKTIKAIMAYDGVSFKELAEKLNTKQQNMSSFFRKDKNNVKLNSVRDICDALGYDIELNFIPKNKDDAE